MGNPNYITPAGYAALKAQYDALLGEERPRIVDVVAWAASNGDRSENADYHYGKKRLRQIDGRIRFLQKRLEAADIVDPVAQKQIAGEQHVLLRKVNDHVVVCVRRAHGDQPH